MDAIKLLQEWHNGLRINHIAHLRAAAEYKLLGRIFGLLVTMFSVVIGTSIFSTLGSSENLLVLLMAGSISVLAAVLSGIQGFLNYPELAAKHKHAGVKYGELRRQIEELIAIEKDPVELEKTMRQIRFDWNALDDESPEISQKFHDQAKAIVELDISKPQPIADPK
ncbi:MAG: SLATT domain-containing protein [bacterium]